MKRILISITTILISAGFSVAQENTLLFSEAVKIALDNNVSLKQQNNQQYVNQAQKRSSMARVAPSVNAFAQAWRVQGNQFIEQEARVVNDAETSNFYGTVDANMVLFNGMSNMNTIRQADANLEAQQHLVARTRQDVITNVSNQYLQCLLDSELLRIAQEDLKNQQTQLNQVTEMVKAGSRAKVDQYNQEATVKAAELAVLRAQIRLRRDKVTLSQTLLIDPETSFEIEQPSWSFNREELDDNTLESLYITAMSNRGDLLRAEKNVFSTKKGMAINRSAFIPTLSAYGSLNSRYSDASIPSFSDQFDANLRKEYGLRLSIPIFTGMQNNTNYVRSRVNHDNAKLDYENAKVAVKADVLNAYQNYRDASVSYDASKAQLEAAELSFRLESERYQLGVSDLVAFTQANQRYVQAKGDMAQASYTLLFQDILLQYATGTLTVDDIP
ncbi:TolC family protein [Fulvivirga lutea]|uniref:TolC family protein n=1 Tax=Fulvivirga lutea TaxID=2810512 RepID=A0A974ZZ94_9BACT|nr:TolC family protein [Fulvivirga lutea]QSE95874.1 TolC family protein [Fulvivirga lutea]